VRLRLADRRVRQLGRQGHSKFTADRPYADPEKAARKIIEVAKAIEPVIALLRRSAALNRAGEICHA
jgi:hypothetical protein